MKTKVYIFIFLTMAIAVIAGFFSFLSFYISTRTENRLSEGFATIEFDISLSDYVGLIMTVSGENGGNCFRLSDNNFRNSYAPDTYSISVWFADTFTQYREFEEIFDNTDCDFLELGEPHQEYLPVSLPAGSIYHVNIWR